MSAFEDECDLIALSISIAHVAINLTFRLKQIKDVVRVITARSVEACSFLKKFNIAVILRVRIYYDEIELH